MSLFGIFQGSSTRDLFEEQGSCTLMKEEEESFRLDSQRIHQHSNERTRGRSSTGLSRLPE